MQALVPAVGCGLGALKRPPRMIAQYAPRWHWLALPPQQVPNPYQMRVGDVVRLTPPEDGVKHLPVQDDARLAIPGSAGCSRRSQSLEDAEAALFHAL